MHRGATKDYHSKAPPIRDLIKRDERQICSLPAYLAARASRGSSPGAEAAAQFTPRHYVHVDDGIVYLSERVLVGRMVVPETGADPAKDMAKFFAISLVEPKFTPIAWDDATGTDFNTAVFKDLEIFLGENGKPKAPEALSLGTDGLCGCTVLMVASRTGVYMAHYFESLSFSTAAVWLDHFAGKDAFEETVIKGLNEGITGDTASKVINPQAEQVSLTAHADRIKEGAGLGGNNIRRFLIHPSNFPSYSTYTKEQTAAMYRVKWDKIKQEVDRILGALPSANVWEEFEYTALNNNDQRLDTTARGKLVFKFDPLTRPPPSTDPNVPTSHKRLKRMTFWLEENRTDLLGDTW